MLEKLAEVEARFQQLNQELSTPEVLQDQARLRQLGKEHRRLEKVVEAYRRLKKVQEDVAGHRELLASGSDPELEELAREELATLEPEQERLEEELKVMLLPTDPNDDKNVILEIRSGTGGDEAALFAGDLYRMYRYVA